MTPIIPTKEAQLAMDQLNKMGYEAFAVGGCVRDSLLGRLPNDWDLTTNARPEETLSVFSGFRVIETGIKHGTVTVLLDGVPIEITTYRLDGAYADNRHPVSVTFSSHIEDDLSRRDFTVNAMAYHETHGIVDPFGGQQDLSDRLIRCVGDPRTRFSEDGLRILRAIRFASVLGFEIEEQTSAAIHACRRLLDNIARERIREEFSKLLCGRNAVSILRQYSDVIGQFLPEILPSVGFAQNSKYHCFDVWEHTLQALSKTESSSLLVRLAILLHDIGKPHRYTEDAQGGHFKGHAEVSATLTDEILTRLRFDNATRALLVKLVRYHDIPLSAEKKHVRRSLLKFGEEGLRALLEIQRCDRLAHAEGYCDLPAYLARIPEEIDRIKEENDCLSLSTLAVKGADLISIGYTPGHALGDALQTLLNAVIDGECPNEKEILLEQAKKLLS